MTITDSRAPGIRTDIQALRAAAVGLVILNHLWPADLPGGFVGVDIFFVISGYLITSHLVRDGIKNRRIHLASFWARRVRRLLPAALLVLVVCLVITYFLVPLPSQRQNYVEIGAAAGYILNWVLAADSVNYFAQHTELILVTHYWSLSVEEQFYLVWPILLGAIFWLTRKQSQPYAKVATVVGIGSVAVASFVWSITAIASQPEAAYFQTTGRAWEFALGGLLAFLPAIGERFQKRLLPLVWAGWALIVASAFLLDGASGVPGPAALIPVVGTMLVIAIGEARSPWSPQQLTSFRPVQLIGELSYSAYLWHFPLQVGLLAATGHLTALMKLGVISATLVLAYLTKRYVEDPVRFGRLQRVNPIPLLSGMVVVVLAFVGVGFAGTNHIDARATAATQRLEIGSSNPSECFGAQAALSGAQCADSSAVSDTDAVIASALYSADEHLPEDASCVNNSSSGTPVWVCGFGAPAANADLSVALVGDSHAMMWVPALAEAAKAQDLHVQTFLHGGCPPARDPDIASVSAGPAALEACRDWRDHAFPMITADPTIDVVIVTARESIYKDSAGRPRPDAYAETWRSWLDAGKGVVVIADVPQLRTGAEVCITPRTPDGPACRVPEPPSGSATVLGEAVDLLSGRRIAYADYTNLVCNEGVCTAVVGGIPAYGDNNHLSAYFTRSIGGDFLKEALTEVG